MGSLAPRIYPSTRNLFEKVISGNIGCRQFCIVQLGGRMDSAGHEYISDVEAGDHCSWLTNSQTLYDMKDRRRKHREMNDLHRFLIISM